MLQQVEDIRIQLPHIELAAKVYGPADGEPVLALHGWLDNAMSFERLAPQLPGLRIVALDMAGHGYSQHRSLDASYQLWDYAMDAFLAAEHLGWDKFSLLGHSLGGIVSVLLSGAMPERIERVALIDGLAPYTGEADEAPEKLREALLAQIALKDKGKPVHPTVESAIKARMQGLIAVSREAAELLVQRGLSPVRGGFTWNTDARLTLPSPLRLTKAHALSFALAVKCPVCLILATEGILLQERGLEPFLAMLPYQQHRLPGGHHLHLDDAKGATAVAECLNQFFAAHPVAG
ncbi:alpha/beta fold hydrolase [Thiopseudomonas alkaliphila]|uniref:Alpha/beta fold hydrolase n=1 Tax=Thiopseudomonas alkaliphila TaxID=1697053 RepID=A0AAW7DQT7_9GAMM|nr:alpha/beta fold hydrolase [Thiopseudomonas alkaliphila]MDM1696209.1 alpha/beta fold hydrolase [Thiopseudomonas alkaliphila]